MELLGTNIVGFDITDQLLIDFLHSPDTEERNEDYSKKADQPIDFEKACDSVKYCTVFSLSLGYPQN
jgi:hypothetical protein